MLDRLLRQTPAPVRPKLVALLGVTTWGGVSVALVAGWRYGLAWVIAGVVGFRLLRGRSVRAAPAGTLAGVSPLSGQSDAGTELPLADLEHRVIARLHQMTAAEGAASTPH
ncbi:MAG: hypothetical protein JWL70_261 [Acidimicrobiia bacterium]|nr:hypothetical protein [Acidimicrobiia bacterium]